MTSAFTALLSSTKGEGSHFAEDRRLRSNLIGEEAKLNKGLVL